MAWSVAVEASSGGRIGAFDRSQALLTSALLNELAKFRRSLRMKRRLVPNCNEWLPFIQARSSTKLCTGVKRIRLRGAAIRSSKVRKLTRCSEASGEEPAASYPSRVKAE